MVQISVCKQFWKLEDNCFQTNTDSTFYVTKVNYIEFNANEPFPCNSGLTITKVHSMQFETMYHTCLYLEWLQSYAILRP